MYPTDKIAYRTPELAGASDREMGRETGLLNATRGLSSVGFGSITVCGALFGIWGATCLASGVLTSSGQDLLKGLLTAITGL